MIRLPNWLIISLDQNRVADVTRKVLPYLKKRDRVLDLGSGYCTVTKELRNKDYNITPIDLKNYSVFPDVSPTIYNGKKLPYQVDEFDVILVITVLHHVREPEKLLAEASRVSKRLIVMEDLVESSIQKFFTSVLDSVLNFEFFGHPHSNKSEREWLEEFQKLNLHVQDFNKHNFWSVMTSGTFYLIKK